MIITSGLKINMENCEHICSGNCRRVGCNCLCGEWHEEKIKNEKAVSLMKSIAFELMKKQDQSRKYCPCCGVSLE